MATVIKKLTCYFMLMVVGFAPFSVLAEAPISESRVIDTIVTVKVHQDIYTKYKPFNVSLNRATGGTFSDTSATQSGDYYIYKPHVKTTAITTGWSVYVKSTSTKDNEGTYVYWSVGLTDIYTASTVTLGSNGNFSGSYVNGSSQVNNANTTSSPGTSTPSPAAGVATGASAGTAAEPAGGPVSASAPGVAIAPPRIDDSKCTSDNSKIKKINGVDTKVYKNGLLTDVPCEGALQTLDQALVIVKNVILIFLLPLVGTLFLIMLIIGGILYITSRGNTQQLERAKKTLTAAIVGLLIVTLSYTIIIIFANVIGGGIS